MFVFKPKEKYSSILNLNKQLLLYLLLTVEHLLLYLSKASWLRFKCILEK